MEAATLLALTNGLTDGVVAGQRSAEEALALLAYRLDRIFSSGGRG